MKIKTAKNNNKTIIDSWPIPCLFQSMSSPPTVLFLFECDRRPKNGLDMVARPLFSALDCQMQANLCELKATLVCIVNSRTAKATYIHACVKKTKETKHVFLMVLWKYASSASKAKVLKMTCISTWEAREEFRVSLDYYMEPVSSNRGKTQSSKLVVAFRIIAYCKVTLK